MFSGITNQMSSWVGSVAKKSDSEVKEDEKPTSPTVAEEEQVEATNAEEPKKETSPVKGNSKLEMLGNVKSTMSTWLGGGIQLPGLRKTESESTEAAPTETKPVESEEAENTGKDAQEKDDDNSSATGGADSDAHLSDVEGDEDKDGTAFAGGAVGAKAVQGAKSIGNFLFSAVNKAGKTVSEASAKIKKTVEENSILGEFNKEQEAFIKEKYGKNGEAAVPPWIGCPNEDSLKQECLLLSTDRRNFVRPPPAGVEFDFDYETSYPVAMATLAADPELDKMRFELVPKVISEENFWRNYFYRVSLICQANELSSMAQEEQQYATNPSQNSEPEPNVYVDYSADQRSQQLLNDTPSEFVSDSLTVSSQEMEEVRENLKKLGIDTTSANEEEWEKELEAELQEYEVVSDQQKPNTAVSSKWESEIEEMLDSENHDLK